MEFRYRAGEGPPSIDPYFSTMQSFRGDIFGGEFRRPEPIRGPPMMMARDALRREMEKERIREEIIAREFMRRRDLEEEVRREMAFEREVALRRQADRFSLAPSSAGLPMRSPRLLELGVGERVAPLSTRDIGEDVLTENESIRRISEVKEEGNAVVAKSSTNHVGTKRKANDVEELVHLATVKKVQKSWKCSLCEISTTSEKGLQEHIEGKKHKSKEKKQQPRTVEIGKKAAFTFKCDHCGIKCNSESMMIAHLKGKRHATRVQESLTDDEAVPEVKEDVKGRKSKQTKARAQNMVRKNVVAAETAEAPTAEVDEGEEENPKTDAAATEDDQGTDAPDNEE